MLAWVLAGTDPQVQIAYIGLAGAVFVAIITGVFGVIVASQTRKKNSDTGVKIDHSISRLDIIEDMHAELTKERKARKLCERRDRRNRQTIAELREQLAVALAGGGAAAE